MCASERVGDPAMFAIPLVSPMKGRSAGTRWGAITASACGYTNCNDHARAMISLWQEFFVVKEFGSCAPDGAVVHSIRANRGRMSAGIIAVLWCESPSRACKAPWILFFDFENRFLLQTRTSGILFSPASPTAACVDVAIRTQPFVQPIERKGNPS